ncbi:hypothetical protein CCACVL1_02632 [Corchorus capsularis]|uniref:Uncharacterized protein n=1 Tax=Corchorus capsularis TaxID=210143 RepID=A0A1R3K7D2_COCAP|nr:hypothetical protein CCACVL1_02632 [Corchorus capsularis]
MAEVAFDRPGIALQRLLPLRRV